MWRGLRKWENKLKMKGQNDKVFYAQDFNIQEGIRRAWDE